MNVPSSLELIEFIYEFDLKLISQIKKELPDELDLPDVVITELAISICKKTESALFLMKNNLFSGVDVIIRSIFETSRILKFILEEDTENRAFAYYLSVQASIEKSLNEFQSLFGIPGEKEKYIRNTDIYEVFMQAFIGDNVKVKPDNWMSIEKKKDGKGRIQSFRDLCEYFGEEDLKAYISIYAYLSKEVHGKEVGLNILKDVLNNSEENNETRFKLMIECLMVIKESLICHYNISEVNL